MARDNLEALRAQGKTGRYLVVMEEAAVDAGLKELNNKAGVRATSVRAFAGADQPGGLTDLTDDSISFDQLGIAVVSAAPDQVPAMRLAAQDARSPIRYIEDERFVFAIEAAAPLAFDAPSAAELRGLPTAPRRMDVELPMPNVAVETTGLQEFLRGYQAAVSSLTREIMSVRPASEVQAALFAQDAHIGDATWGLVATNVLASAFSGQDIRVAILDTGLDAQHPDFQGRNILMQSFVDEESAQDVHGHGTHCCGTAVGNRKPASGGPRYGIAYNANLYAGKVLSNTGNGTDASILAGINWAIQNKCAIASMSLGAATKVGDRFSRAYETAATRALSRGTLLIAAAGNESRRPKQIAPVGSPANCPSILAVAAVDEAMRVAPFSSGGLNPDGGEVNIGAPGVDIFSSWPQPVNYKTISGTSMATPHVTGIAALWAEATGLRGMELANTIFRASRRLQARRDIGWGLVQSP